MATTTKKTTKKTAVKSGGTQKRTPAKKKPTAQKKTVPQTNPPIRREVGAVLCFFLAFFSFLGCVGVKALFIDLFCSL